MDVSILNATRIAWPLNQTGEPRSANIEETARVYGPTLLARLNRALAFDLADPPRRPRIRAILLIAALLGMQCL